MADERRIRIMTALAVYDKYYGQQDRRIEGNYKWDYIYKKNCWNRICVTFGFLILVGIYGLYLIFIKEINLATFDVMAEAKRIGMYWLLLMAAYSVLGFFLYGWEYKDAQRRLDSYRSLLTKLEEYEE